MYSVDYVNDPMYYCKNYKMVSINSCVQVDLNGTSCSRNNWIKQFSGVGGQVDFIRGAAMGNGGKSIIAMPSTAVKEKFQE